VRHYPPESTYLAWLDCRGLGLPAPPEQFFLERAQVALRGGPEFGPRGAGCVRLTFATSREILNAMVDRMAKALHRE
jgi:cystathionine beta-lyase